MGMPQKDAVIPEDAPNELLLDKHVDFIATYGKTKATEFDYSVSEFLRINGIYWSLTALDIMNARHKLADSPDQLMEFVLSCYHRDSGGFGPCPQHDPHLLYTLSAIQVAVILDRLDMLDLERIEDFICGLQQDDGSFVGDAWKEVDTRFSFCAVAALSLMGKLETADIDLDQAVNFVESCMNFDGGFGTRPGSESHAGQIYCCVGFLSITGELHRVDADLLGWWLAERQLPSGGLNGRPEKLPDVCYSWWVLSSLSIIGRLSWIDSKALKKFILASQDDETGGISDRPGDYPDPFHTLFGVAGISLMNRTSEEKDGQESLGDINPVYCMPQVILDRIGIKHQMLTL